MRAKPRTTPSLPITLLLVALAAPAPSAAAPDPPPAAVGSGAGAVTRPGPPAVPSAGRHVIRELARLDERLGLGTFPDASPLWPTRVAAALEHLLRAPGTEAEVPAAHLLRRLAVELRLLGTGHGLDGPPEHGEGQAAPSDAAGRERDERLGRVLETVRLVHDKLDRSRGDVPSQGGLVRRVAPGNDDCASAQALGLGTVTGSTASATNDGSASCGSSSSTPDVWYTFTAPSADTYRFNTFGSSYDTVLSLWDACDAGDGRSSEIACDDDTGGSQSEIVHPLAAGETVLIRVSGFSGATGDYTLSVLRRQGISGTVTRADTGAPLAGVTVRVFDNFGGPPGEAVTESDGSYFLARSAGTYYVRTDNDAGFVDEVYDDIPCPFYSFCDPREDGTPVTVTEGVNSGIDFTLELSGSLSGSLTDAATGDPLAGYVYVYGSTGNYLDTFFTGSDGTYQVTGVPAGKYYVVGEASDYRTEVYDDVPCGYPCDPTSGTQVIVAAGADVTGIDLALDAYPAIEGALTESGTGDPIAGEMVEFYDSTGDWSGWAWTSGDGTYRFESVAPGTYFVRTDTDHHRNELYDDLPCQPSCAVTTGTPVEAILGSTTTGIDFELVPFGKLAGTVTEAGTGDPLANLRLEIYTTTGSFREWAYTAADGSYVSPGLPGGNYLVLSDTTGHVNEVYDDVFCDPCDVTTGTPVAVSDDSITPGIDFILQRRGSISGRVTHRVTGAALGSARVEAYGISGYSFHSTYTSADGTYTMQNLPPGSYSVQTDLYSHRNEVYDDMPCPGSCYGVAGTPVSVAAATDTPGIDFALERLGYLEGSVTARGTGQSVEGYVYLITPAGTYVDSEYTFGAFSFENISAGSYYVKAEAWDSAAFQDELFDDVPCEPGCDLSLGTALSVQLNGGVVGVDLELGTCPVDSYEDLVATTIFSLYEVEACERVSGTGVTVKPGANVTFKAGRRVVLGDGFRVESGGRFRAVIEPAWRDH